jgi:hypothetical protein
MPQHGRPLLLRPCHNTLLLRRMRALGVPEP